MQSGNPVSVSAVVLVALASCLGGAVLASCAGPHGDESNSDKGTPGGTSASISLALVNVPTDALCLEFTITPTASPSGAKTQLFSVAPGTSPTITMDGFPAGQATITARGFDIDCAQVQASTTLTWVSAAPVTLTLVSSQTVNASIVLRRPGNVQITATFDDGALTISPNPMTFPIVAIGTGATVNFTVTNSGTTTVTLPTATISGTDASQFSNAPIGTCGPSLAAGATCTGVLNFTPTSAGDKSATLTLGSATVSITGTAIVGAFTLSPSPLAFGSVPVGSSASLALTLTNPTTISLYINASTITGTNLLEFSTSTIGSTCVSPIQPGASCTRVVTFTPTSAGAKTASLSIGANSVSLTGTAIATPVYRINCGSSSAASPFAADQYASGGTQHTVTNTIAIIGITNPAPQAVYQSERYGNLTYTLPSLTASATYTVRLHFAELYQTAAGKRVFNVAINGATVLSNFDIYASAGGNYKALVREFTTTANASGQIVVTFTTVTDNASIGGIEILK
jgi:hypothetical protein